MKIAILTQPLHTNYGGNLQNFALQKVLKDMGHQPVTIDRHKPIPLSAKLKLGYFKRLLYFFLGRGKKPIFKAYFSAEYKAEVHHEINHFIKTHITKTPRLYSDARVHQVFAKEQFDAVIVGSDQCWRPMYSPSIYTYYLDFLQKNKKLKKISYAASFGTDEWEYTTEQTTKCKELLEQFNLVTVREKSAVNIVKEKFNKEAQFVLDPTLLLSKKDYEQLFNTQNLPSYKGIYTYILDKNDWKCQVVETVKNKLGLEQYSNQHDAHNVGQEKIPSIESWIKGFADADFVITDSFHGTIFSIIFNKPFISLVNVSRGVSRFESILDELGLMQRLVGDYDQQEIEALVQAAISYGGVNQKLNTLRSQSNELLAKAL